MLLEPRPVSFTLETIQDFQCDMLKNIVASFEFCSIFEFENSIRHPQHRIIIKLDNKSDAQVQLKCVE